MILTRLWIYVDDFIIFFSMIDPRVIPHFLSRESSNQTSYVWTVSAINPFDELLISWNAERPLQGHYVILVSVFHCVWSPWLLYAVWGAHEQYSFHETTSQSPVRTFQDQVELLDGNQATGFRIRIEACNGANLAQFYSLYACASSLASFGIEELPPQAESIALPFNGLSQLCLKFPRSNSLCSPASTTSVIHYALLSSDLDPLDFARQVYDSAFDIYGNWSFNVAQAFVQLGREWQCYCARMGSFKMILNRLRQGFPTVVSVKGHFTNSLKPYSSGHLMVVRGYDATSRKVLCMDPAFLTNDETLISYPLTEFLQAWANRHNLTYTIVKSEKAPIVTHSD